MSLLKIIRAQLGLSATAANNFTLDASAADGSMKLARGNAGATTQDILTVTPAGAVRLPKNLIAFDVYSTSDQAVTSNLTTKITFTTKVFDPSGAFDNTVNSRFQPSVAGYYQINARVRPAATSGLSSGRLEVYKNGLVFSRLCETTSSASGSIYGSQLVYLNGTTDYLEFFGTVVGTGTCSFSVAGDTNGYYGHRINGALVQAA